MRISKIFRHFSLIYAILACIFILLRKNDKLKNDFFCKNNGKLKLVVTNSITRDICLELDAINIDVYMLQGGGSCCNGYEPSMSDLLAIINADVFFYSESCLNIKSSLSVISNIIEKKFIEDFMIDLSYDAFITSIKQLKCKCHDDTSLKDNFGHKVCIKNFAGSIKNIIFVAEQVHAILLRKSTTFECSIHENYKILYNKLTGIKKKIETLGSNIAKKKFLVVGHTSLKPFFYDLGCDVEFVDLDSDEGDISSKDIFQIIDKVHKSGRIVVVEDESLVDLLGRLLKNDYTLIFLKPLNDAADSFNNVIDVLEYNLYQLSKFS